MLLRSLFALLQLVVLARLLPKDELGLLAVAMAIQNLILIVSDLGLSSALIHHREVNDRQRSTLFWINVGMGFGACMLMMASSGAVAAFYGETELAPILALMSLVFPLAAFGQQHRAMAEKTLNFRTLAKIEIVAGAAGVLVAVIGVVSGMGVNAAVAGLLISTALTSAMAWLMLAGGWRPQAVLAVDETRPFLRYGIDVVGLSFFNALGQQADVIVAGRLFSPAVVGSYHPPREFGMRVMMIVNPIVTRISFPIIADAQHDRQKVATLYAQTLLMTASVNFPLYAMLGLFAHAIVEIVLGPSWLSSVPLLQAVACWCAVRSIGNPIGSLLLGIGATGLALRSSIAVSMLVLVFATAGGLLGGPLGVPASLAVLYAMLIVGFWRLLVWPSCGLGFRRYHEQLLRPATCTMVAAAVAWTAGSLVTGSVAVLVVGGTAGCVAYLAISALVNPEWLRVMSDLVLSRRPRTAA